MNARWLIDHIETQWAQSSQQACRLLNGRGHCYQGYESINIDRFDTLLLLTLYQSLERCVEEELLAYLSSASCPADVVYIQRRYLANPAFELLKHFDHSNIHYAIEGDLRYQLQFGGNQNFGFFLDMRPGREWLLQHAKGKRVLNLFAYSCSLSVAAIAAGALSVVNIDLSKQALSMGRQNHRENGFTARLKRDVSFLGHDIFKSWKRLADSGPYDLVIIDPPSRQQGSFVAEKDYARVLRRLPRLMPGGGQVLACLNSPHLESSFLKELFLEELPAAQFIERLPNRDDFPERFPERAVKLMCYRLPPGQA